MQGSLFETDSAAGPASKPKPVAAKKPPRPLPEPLDDTATRRPRLPHPLRDVAAAELTQWLADWGRGDLTEDELVRAVRGSTYVLENAELVEVAEFMIRLLRGTP